MVMARPPTTKAQEITTGKYCLIWSGLSVRHLYSLVETYGSSKFTQAIKLQWKVGRPTPSLAAMLPLLIGYCKTGCQCQWHLEARSPITSCTSLWCWITKPPFLRDNAHERLKGELHPSLRSGISLNGLLYQMANASLNSWAGRSKRLFTNGNTISHPDTIPFFAMVIALWCAGSNCHKCILGHVLLDMGS